mmetsp:Transcript_89162/g.248121  ORF Transcript_89162/g.248121 Transcript_89162/m.248121 type:complete len:243 (+) Transcript_89162:83-811(+)
MPASSFSKRSKRLLAALSRRDGCLVSSASKAFIMISSLIASRSIFVSSLFFSASIASITISSLIASRSISFSGGSMASARPARTIRSPASSLLAVTSKSFFANRLPVRNKATRRSHTLRPKMDASSSTSSRFRSERSDSPSASPSSLLISDTSFLVVSTVFSSWSQELTSGEDSKRPRGSTMVPKRVLPFGSVPDLSLAWVQSDRDPADAILASCSSKISCKGVSSSVIIMSKTWSAAASNF